MEKISSKLVLLLVCVLSRLLSSVYYIEDAESMEIVTQVLNQPGPDKGGELSGHSLFILVSKIAYLIIPDLSIIYSVIGGVSVYFIILTILKLIKVPLLSLEGILTGILIFFNPLIWITSNKYIPDLAGVAIALGAFYYLMTDSNTKNDLLKGWFLLGLLGGVKAFYYPFLIIPFGYAIARGKFNFWCVLALIGGLLVWILPVVILKFETLKELTSLHSWFDFTVSNNLGQNFTGFIRGVWSDGLGGYWIDRNPSLIPLSIGMAACIIFGMLILLNFDFNRKKAFVLLASMFVYTIWVFFFDNIAQNSNKLVLLLPFYLICISYGIIYFLVNFNLISVKVMALLFILGYIFLTVILTVQHTYPTAITQAKEYILNKKTAEEKVAIVAPYKISNYLASQNIKARFVSTSEDSIFSTAFKLKGTRERIIIVGFRSPLKDKNIIHFSHNPYVNRNWSEIFLYEYQNDDK